MRRALIHLVSTAVCLSLPLAPHASSAAVEQCPLKIVKRDPGWTSIELPELPEIAVPSARGAYRLFEGVPGDPNTLFVANESQLYRTLDGGCSWQKIYPRNAVDGFVDCTPSNLRYETVNPGCNYLYDLDVALKDGRPRIFLQVHTGGITPGTSLLFASEDLGDNWTQIDLGPQAGMLVGRGPLTVAKSDPDVLYLARSSLTRSHAMASSLDGGRTWSVLPLPGSTSSTIVRELPPVIVSPTDPKEIWTTGYGMDPETSNLEPRFVLHSTDGGQSWTRALSGDADDLDVATRKDGSALLAVLIQRTLHISLDGGRTWTLRWEMDPALPQPRDVEISSNGNYIFLLGDEQISRFDMVRNTAATIKNRSYESDDEQTGDRSTVLEADLVPGSGYYIFGNCWYRDSCTDLHRYSGRGAT